MKTIKLLIVASILVSTSLTGCGNMKTDKIVTIADVANIKTVSTDNTVYIKELGEYVPYLVLAASYNNTNSTLLLRSNLLSLQCIFNPTEVPAARYENSVLDRLLEEDFLLVFDEDIQKTIQPVPIATIKYDELGKANPESILINRRVFVLSTTELGLPASTLEAVEGKSLAYFSNSDSRIAYNEKNEAASWWTRTAHNWGGDQAIGISPEGTAGSGSTSSLNGVRPAFCLPSDLPVTERQDIIPNKTVYVVE